MISVRSHAYFIHIAYALWRDSGDTEFLNESIGGHRLLDRLERAFHSPASDPKTGAAVTYKERRAVGFGFQDSVYLLRAMSFATLLRYRAARVAPPHPYPPAAACSRRDRGRNFTPPAVFY